MVTLRSGGRQDVALLISVWVLSVAVLAGGIALVQPILIFWGAVGLIGAGFLTRVYRRTRAAHDPAADGPADDSTTRDEEKVP